jgi:hypothetical protein
MSRSRAASIIRIDMRKYRINKHLRQICGRTGFAIDMRKYHSSKGMWNHVEPGLFLGAGVFLRVLDEAASPRDRGSRVGGVCARSGSSGELRSDGFATHMLDRGVDIRIIRMVSFCKLNAGPLPATALNRLTKTVRCAPLAPSRGESPRPSDFSYWLRNEKSLVCYSIVTRKSFGCKAVTRISGF